LTYFRAITNDGSVGGWGICDGSLDAEKWEALTADATRAAAMIPVAGGRELVGRVLQSPIWSSSPEPFAVGPPFPNPWHGRVAWPVSGNPLAPWKLLVYDLRGRLIRRFAPRLLATGKLFFWDGQDERGRTVPAGGYLLRVGQAGAAATRQVVLALRVGGAGRWA
jgi:hypothetical protein